MLVSGFINLNILEPNRDNNRSIVKYIELGQKLLDLEVPKIIFLDESVIDKFKINESNTTIVKFNFEDLYLYQYHDIIISQCTNPSPNIVKDSKYYMMVQNQKPMWVTEACKLFPEISHFYWIDFGIFHISNNDQLFSKTILDISCNLDRIKIPGCWDPKQIQITDNQIFNSASVMWYFCGGFFIGHRNQLMLFNDLVKNQLNLMIRSKRITFEVNIWLSVYRDHPELFDWYLANHDISMISVPSKKFCTK